MLKFDSPEVRSLTGDGRPKAEALFFGEGLFSNHYLTDRLPQSELFADADEAGAAYNTLRTVYQGVKNALPGGNTDILDIFPIVRRADEAKYAGKYRLVR